jgi:hypothetical protein
MFIRSFQLFEQFYPERLDASGTYRNEASGSYENCFPRFAQDNKIVVGYSGPSDGDEESTCSESISSAAKAALISFQNGDLFSAL